MTVIVFLIDSSASMYQRTYSGLTLLDVAKGAVETFLKVRRRFPESRGDRYMLLTFEDPPDNIKAGWKEDLATFMNELKNLQCIGMSTMGAALKHAFDVLNINRMQTGIDTYGQGRYPYLLEPSVIVVITDGGKLSSSGGVQEDLEIPMHRPIPGAKLTREPFRWDQRVFSLVLRLSGTPALDHDNGLVPRDSSPIDAMCEVTGGRSYCITSHRMLMQCIDSLVQKFQSGVVINFEKIGPDPPPVTAEGAKADSDVTIVENDSESKGNNDKEWDKDCSSSSEEDKSSKSNGAHLCNSVPGSNTISSLALSSSMAWQSCRCFMYVPCLAARTHRWPIPESFWPDPNSSALPPRSAHPILKCMYTNQKPMVNENLPAASQLFDKYELEPSPVTQFILAHNQPTVCWQVFVENSYKKSGQGYPFGYLMASTSLKSVHLFVMPYNYQMLLPLLEELFQIHRLNPTNEWRTRFQKYLWTVPTYYAEALRKSLIRMGVQGNLARSLIPDNFDGALRYEYKVRKYLQLLKFQSKKEFDRLCNKVVNKPAGGPSSATKEVVTVVDTSQLNKYLFSHPVLKDKLTSLHEHMQQFHGFVVSVASGHRQEGSQSYHNPFYIPRHCLLDHLVRMRANFFKPALSRIQLTADDFTHTVPVSQMGNYQEYLKCLQSQLHKTEPAPVRQEMFGNPFRTDKRIMVDEADKDEVGGGSGTHGMNSGDRSGTNIVHPTWTPLLHGSQVNARVGQFPNMWL